MASEPPSNRHHNRSRRQSTPQRRTYSRSTPSRSSNTSTSSSQDLLDTSSTHGYDAVFEPELSDKYKCPVCLATMREPVQTKCGHRFCRLCLRRTSGTGRYARCPFDNTWYDVTKDVFVDKATEREILSFVVKCHQYEDGCSWTGELRELEAHDGTCQEKMEDCKFKCGAKKKRRELSQHVESCPKRDVPCKHCGILVCVTDILKHELLECPKFPMMCVVCQQTTMLRYELEKHIDEVKGDCPLVRVACPYQAIGCDYVDHRCAIQPHIDNSWHQHLDLIKCTVMRNETKSAERAQEMEQSRKLEADRARELTRTVRSLENVVRLQTQKIKELEKKLQQINTDK